jgi:hypothetical protein
MLQNDIAIEILNRLKVGLHLKRMNIIIPIFEVTVIPTTNQPANDSISITSASASDTQLITIWGIDMADVIQTKTFALTGTTPVVSTLATNNWKTFYGAFLGDEFGNISKRAVGTLTIKEVSGGLTITTIAATKLSAGMQRFNMPLTDVILENISGTTFYNDASYLADTLGKSIQMTGRMSNDFACTTYLTMVSDSASTVQLITYL